MKEISRIIIRGRRNTSNLNRLRAIVDYYLHHYDLEFNEDVKASIIIFYNDGSHFYEEGHIPRVKLHKLLLSN